MLNLVSLIDQVVIARALAKQKEHDSRGNIVSHWPSSARVFWNDKVYGRCQLLSYRKMLKVKPTNPIGVDTLQKFEWGNVFEDWVSSSLMEVRAQKNSPITSIDYQVPIKFSVKGLKYPVSGKIDQVLNKNIGVECKSSFGKFFYGADGLFKKGPKKEAILQVLCYLKGNEDLDGCILFYVSRDMGMKVSYEMYRKKDGVVVVHKHPYSGEETRKVPKYAKWPYLVESWMKLEKCIKKGNEPAPDFHLRSKYPCSYGTSYCEFYNLCFVGHEKYAKKSPRFDDGA